MNIGRIALSCMALTLGCIAPSLTSAQSDEEIVVTGQRLREAVRAFVTAVTVETGNENQVARWDGVVCPGVIGMTPTQAQAVVDRIAMHALNLGLRVDAPGCEADILVIFTHDSDTIAREVVDQRRRGLGYYDGDTRGHEALEAFADTPRPVRWWHVAHSADRTGFLIPTPQRRFVGAGRQGLNGGDPSLPLPSVDAPDGGSRVGRATHQVFTRALIIVDADRVSGARVGTIADYVSMAALAQLDPDADTSAWPTILNAFRAGVPAEEIGLTDWDMAYLEGLYGAEMDRSGSTQRRAIQRAVVEGAE